MFHAHTDVTALKLLKRDFNYLTAHKQENGIYNVEIQHSQTWCILNVLPAHEAKIISPSPELVSNKAS